MASKFGFPKRFLWGATTSAHQVEGGTHNQWTAWELDHARSRAAQAEYEADTIPVWDDVRRQAKSPASYVSGKLADHYGRYEEDIEIIASLGLSAHRFGIEWSRVEPAEDSWDAEALAHYKRYVMALKARGIEPVLTLFHQTLPEWFVEKGGFASRRNTAYFVRFASRIIEELGANVRYVVTMDEPDVYAYEGYYTGHYPPGVRSRWQLWRVLGNLAHAHRQAAKTIRAQGRRYRVGIATRANYFYAGDTAWLSRLSAAMLQYFSDDYFLSQVASGSDFLGVNYYQSQRVYGYRVHNPEVGAHSDLGWHLQPADLEYVLERLHGRYHRPLVVTASGVADMHDEHREWWLRESMLALRQALELGVDVQGYFYHGLLDGFEWSYGRWPRHGLVAIDYKTGERTVRRSATRWAAALKKLRPET